MIIAVELDFYKNIDKLLRDNYKYVQCCLLCLIETVSTTQIPAILAATKESFDSLASGKLKTDGYKSLGLTKVLQVSKKEFSNLKGGLMMVLAVSEMMTSSSFKSKICKQNLIKMLDYCFQHPEFE